MPKDNVTPLKPEKKPDGDMHSVVVDHAFKLDDHAREIDELKKAMGASAEEAKGVLAAFVAIVDQRIEQKVAEAVSKHGDRSQAMLQQMLARHDEGEVEVTKHGTVETPDGVHKMTVVETHRRKP